MANDDGTVLEAEAKGVMHRPPAGHAPRTVLERLNELAPPWQVERLAEAMLKRGQLEREGDTGARSRFLFSEAEGNRAQIGDWYEPSWALYRWQPPVEPRAQPPRGAGVSTFARRLMAIERARLRHSFGASSLDWRPSSPPRLS